MPVEQYPVNINGKVIMAGNPFVGGISQPSGDGGITAETDPIFMAARPRILTTDTEQEVTGSKTFGGIQTFQNIPRVDSSVMPFPNMPEHITTKAYVDNSVENIKSDVVTISSSQVVTGAKTFSYPVSGADASSGNQFVTKNQLDSAIISGGGGGTPMTNAQINSLIDARIAAKHIPTIEEVQNEISSSMMNTFLYKGEVSSMAELPSAGVDDFDYYIVTDTMDALYAMSVGGTIEWFSITPDTDLSGLQTTSKSVQDHIATLAAAEAYADSIVSSTSPSELDPVYLAEKSQIAFVNQDERITGDWIFDISPQVPTVTESSNDNCVTTKGYVDSATGDLASRISSIEVGGVTIDTNQTITGAKTFSGGAIVNNPFYPSVNLMEHPELAGVNPQLVIERLGQEGAGILQDYIEGRKLLNTSANQTEMAILCYKLMAEVSDDLSVIIPFSDIPITVGQFLMLFYTKNAQDRTLHIQNVAATQDSYTRLIDANRASLVYSIPTKTEELTEVQSITAKKKFTQPVSGVDGIDGSDFVTKSQLESSVSDALINIDLGLFPGGDNEPIDTTKFVTIDTGQSISGDKTFIGEVRIGNCWTQDGILIKPTVEMSGKAGELLSHSDVEQMINNYHISMITGGDVVNNISNQSITVEKDFRAPVGFFAGLYSYGIPVNDTDVVTKGYVDNADNSLVSRISAIENKPEYVLPANVLTTDTTQSVTGQKTFSNYQTFAKSVSFMNERSSFDLAPVIESQPTDGSHAANKSYVDSAISQNIPQTSSNNILLSRWQRTGRVIGGLDEVVFIQNFNLSELPSPSGDSSVGYTYLLGVGIPDLESGGTTMYPIITKLDAVIVSGMETMTLPFDFSTYGSGSDPFSLVANWAIIRLRQLYSYDTSRYIELKTSGIKSPGVLDTLSVSVYGLVGQSFV